MRTAWAESTNVDDAALDEALARIAELTARLHAVADLHVPRRTLLGTRACRACARAWPCPTQQAGQQAGRRAPAGC